MKSTEDRIINIERLLRELVTKKRAQEEEDGYVSKKEAEKISGYSIESLRKFRRDGVLKKIKTGKSGRPVFYNKEELLGLRKDAAN